MPSNTKPITPDEILTKKRESLPDFVLDAFNTLLAANWDGHKATVVQNDVILHILGAAPEGIHREDIFSNHWLDVEDIYREVGWKVRYNKPAYNEDYDAYYRFSKKK